jgi:hypothetical protein
MNSPKSESGDDIPDTHNFTEAVGTRLSPKTKRRFEDYRDREEIGNSEALRRLIRTGLDASDGPNTLTDRLTRATLLTVLLGFPALTAWAGYTSVAATFVATLVLATLLEPQITTLWHRLKSALST